MPVSSAFLTDARIVIVGAGAVGSVIGYRLAQSGASVTVVDRNFPGSGTTGNSFAWLNSFGKSPRDYHRLNVRSIREHQDLATELDGTWVHIGGGLAWEHHSNDERSRLLKEKVRQLHQFGYRIETLSPQQAMQEVDSDLFIDPELVEEVHYAPNEGWINGVGLCHGATSAAVRRYGATFIRDEVVGFGGNQGAIDSVELASGTFLPTDAVVNAAGPNAAQIAAYAGINLPISQQPGLLITTEPAPVNLKTVVHAPETFVHADGGWRLLLHREDYDSLADTGAVPDVSCTFPQNALDNASKILPGLRGVRPEGVRLGIRPMPKDGHPIVGFDPDVAGFYQAVMHSGVTLSAAIGTLAVEDFLGDEAPELEPYRPERFGEQTSLAFHPTDE